MILQTAMHNYIGFAHYYDTYAQEFDYAQWFVYLKKLSGVGSFNGKQILDLGCGSGILLSEFVQEGAKAIGVDLSADMLAEADQKLFLLNKKAELICADITAFLINRRFDFIYSSCDTINYLSTHQLPSLLENVAAMLNPGARFTFDILNRDNFIDQEETDEFRVDGVSFLFHRYVGEATLRTELRIEDGTYALEEEHIQYFHTVETIVKLARDCGLNTLGIYRIYNFDSPDAESEKVQIVLEKPKISIN